MPCSLPSSLARSATKSRQFTPDGQGQFLRRDDDGRSVGRPMGRVAQRRDCKKDTEREAKPSPPSDRASASVGSVPSLECRVLRPSSVSLQLVNKFVLDSRDSRSYLYYLESKSHVKRENFIFAATSIIGGQSQSSVRIFFDFFRLSSFGAIVQWQDRQYVGAFWEQNQGIPHILSMSNLYPAHPHKISLFCPWGHY